MMPLLPKPYPDEVVGSIILRGCLHYGIPLKVMLSWLHGPGTRRGSCSFLLEPSVVRIARPCGLTPLDVLYRHTIFPYVVAFHSSAQRSRLEARLLEGDDPMLSTSALVQNVTQVVRYRRYCPACVREEQLRYGETYWHRMHQMPTALLCEAHHVPLVETTVRTLLSARPGEISLPPTEECRTVDFALPNALALILLERTIAAIDGDSVAPADRVQQYRRMARQAGYVHPSGVIAAGALAYALQANYGSRLLSALKCEVHGPGHRTWPALLMRPRNREPVSVVRHVLLDAFLAKARVDTQTQQRLRKRNYPSRDYDALDKVAVSLMEAHLERAANEGRRLTVTELLDAAGVRSAYKHERAKFPRCRALIVRFRHTAQAERQIGGRDYWRKRTPSRWGLDRPRLQLEDVSPAQGPSSPST